MRILLAAILLFGVAAGAQSEPKMTDAPNEGIPYHSVTPCSDSSAGCAVVDTVAAVLKHALSKPDSGEKPKLMIKCTDKNVVSDLPVGCPTLRIAWHNMFAGPEKTQNVTNANYEVELDSRTAKYGVEVSTIDGKWHQKFLNVRSGDTIEISYKKE